MKSNFGHNVWEMIIYFVLFFNLDNNKSNKKCDRLSLVERTIKIYS